MNCPMCGLPQAVGNRFCGSCGAALVAGTPATAPATWWGRHWKWFLPAGCLTLLLLFGGGILAFVGLVFGSLRSSEPYQTAMETLRETPEAMELLGEPLKEGWFVSGQVNWSGSGGHADLAIPLTGARASATLFVVAHREAGEWHYERMELVAEDGSWRLDLLAEEENQPGEDEPEEDDHGETAPKAPESAPRVTAT
jgi:hypothetical protein